jgi:DNA replication and repair protein RecF
MILDFLRLHHVRNHRLSEIDCPPNIALLWGDNGAGKTSVLETVSLLCMTRSFVTHQTRTLVQRDAGAFTLYGRFRTGAGATREVHFRYDLATKEKDIQLDHAPLRAAADLIGQFPLVILSPSHRGVTSGGPAERRAFMDFVIAQVSHAYLLDLIEFRRIARHRAALLAQQSDRAKIRAALEPWNHSFAEHAVRIVRRRLDFLEHFRPYADETMAVISGARETPDLAYRHSADCGYTDTGAEERFLALLERRTDGDIRLRSNTIGPHRDDVHFSLNDLDVRAQASQGQHKSVLIALKIAEARYLADHLDEAPILLFDDIFSELDDARLSHVMGIVSGIGQTFITTANASVLRAFPLPAPSNGAYRVCDGAVASYAEVV